MMKEKKIISLHQVTLGLTTNTNDDAVGAKASASNSNSLESSRLSFINKTTSNVTPESKKLLSSFKNTPTVAEGGTLTAGTSLLSAGGTLSAAS